MLKLSAYVQNFLFRAKEDEGQTMAEYGVILAVITVGIVAALGVLSTGIRGAIENVVSTLTPGP